MKKIVDSVFGELKYELGWRKIYNINIFGCNNDVILIVDGEENREIMEEQREIFLEFDKNKKKFLNIAEENLFKYYVNNLDEIRDYIDKSEWDDLAPQITNRNQLSRILTPCEVIIPNFMEEGSVVFAIAFNNTWQEEHTLVIKFENDSIEIGSEDIIL
ncbi:DUF6985 domain-containing protein [Clostridium estertheticum]|uniref:DUF6985 domain-containing protein n=1 Tax=Clostridium estertheticum subsp. estertheticum TaxID=1552 RepID=A0A1J0GG09_9CLOT|nr:hypothetical protein [Clostridium estertheticum]APC40306.1 hypothetical protein A7L45_09620 [Clostridium estertheticum subsp. estertheticum]MBZ9617888.1 hypothetical protein [Clostridium estertheticum subsp. laramiense]WAG73549.1 hypothetical protein LL032_20905 [Clostridium estertheticum]